MNNEAYCLYLATIMGVTTAAAIPTAAAPHNMQSVFLEGMPFAS